MFIRRISVRLVKKLHMDLRLSITKLSGIEANNEIMPGESKQWSLGTSRNVFFWLINSFIYSIEIGHIGTYILNLFFK